MTMGVEGFWVAERIGAKTLRDRIGDQMLMRANVRRAAADLRIGAELFGVRRGDELLRSLGGNYVGRQQCHNQKRSHVSAQHETHFRLSVNIRNWQTEEE